MQISRETKATYNDVINIKIEKDDYKQGYENKLKKYSKEISIKGFRKGMAPAGMVRKMYGESILAEEINHLAEKSLSDFIKENNIKLLGRPILADESELLDIKPGEDKEYNLNFEIGFEPEFNIDFSKETFKKYEIDFKPEMLEKELANVKTYFAKLEDSDEPVVDGDSIYFTIKNGQNIDTESYSGTQELTDAGKTAFIGKKKGDEFNGNIMQLVDSTKLDVKKYVLNITDETQISDEEVNGEMTISITNVKKKVTPEELTEENILSITRDESKKSIEDLKAFLETEIKHQYSNVALNYTRVDLYEYLVNQLPIELPIDFLKRWLVSEPENKITPEMLEKDMDGIMRSIKWDLITNKYSLENDVKVSVEDVKHDFKMRYLQIFAQSGYTPEEAQLEGFVNDAMKDQKNVRKTYETLLDNKVLDKMAEGLNYEVVKFTEEEFVAETKRREEVRKKMNDEIEEEHIHDENCGHNH